MFLWLCQVAKDFYFILGSIKNFRNFAFWVTIKKIIFLLSGSECARLVHFILLKYNVSDKVKYDWIISLIINCILLFFVTVFSLWWTCIFFVNLQKIWLLENGGLKKLQKFFKWNRWICCNYGDVLFNCIVNQFFDFIMWFLFANLF